MIVKNIASLLPYLVLVSHVVFIVLLLALVFRRSWGREITCWLGKHAVILALIVAMAAVVGSLFYSELIGFEPCVLCWWQRIFLYPLVIVFGMAVWKKAASVFLYAVPLAFAAALIAAYQSYVYLGGDSFLTCTALDGACSKIYVMAFGYITIPMMSLTISLYALLFAWAYKIYRNEDCHT